MPTACYLHKHREATGACSACQRPICTRCTGFEAMRPVCPTCVDDVRSHGRWRVVGQLVVGVLGLGAVAAMATFALRQRGAADAVEARVTESSAATPDPGPSRESLSRAAAAARVAESKARVAAAEAAAARSKAEVAEALARETTARAANARAVAVVEHEGVRAAAMAADRALAAARAEEASARQAEARARLGEVPDVDGACLMPTRRKGNTIMVEVDFDGSVAQMILDTGATHTLVTQAFAEGARLAVGDERHVAGTANGETEFAVAEVALITIGGRTLGAQRVGVCGNCALGEADGLLGVDVLKAMHVQIDLPTGTARFGDCE